MSDDVRMTHGPGEDARRTFEQALQRILWELRAYLADVVIGGWVPYLYQRSGTFPTWRGRLALTTEVDILVAPELPPGDRPPIPEILTSAGFEPVQATRHAAVWVNEPERGEKVEFLVPHTGPYRDLGQVVPVRAQRGMGAISLTALEVMQRHTRTLPVLARSPDGTQVRLDVRVPLLGAYVLNKAATFQKRSPLAAATGVRSNPKKAKDLLYLRDVVHAGADVVAAMEPDVAAILEGDPTAQHLLDAAASNLDAITSGGSGEPPAIVDEVGAMLTEWEPGMSRAAASANVAGHLTDLASILRGFRSPAPEPEADEADDEDDGRNDG